MRRMMALMMALALAMGGAALAEDGMTELRDIRKSVEDGIAEIHAPEVTPAPEAEPTPSPTPDMTVYTPLTAGAKGDAVTRLQQRLRALGLLEGSADGIYGAKTADAVKRFQQSEGLEPTGEADAETQRALMLRHGVGLSPGRISVITGMPVGMIRRALNRYLSRVRRAMPGGQRGRAEAHIHRAMTRQLAARQGVPPPAAVYRAFEAEASGLQPPTHRLSQVIYRVLVLVMALVCAALFWLFAVLVQPPAMQGQGQAVTTQAPEQ